MELLPKCTHTIYVKERKGNSTQTKQDKFRQNIYKEKCSIIHVQQNNDTQ